MPIARPPWPLLALSLLVACRDEAPPPAAPPPAETTRPTSTAPRDLMSAMRALLQHEAAHRPTGTPTTEAVMQALGMAGIACDAGSQSIAAVIDAAYCWQSRTTDGALAFSICEFPSEAAVKNAQEVSLTKFAAMGPRTFLVQGHTMLTVKLHQPAGEALIPKMKAAIAGLR